MSEPTNTPQKTALRYILLCLLTITSIACQLPPLQVQNQPGTIRYTCAELQSESTSPQFRITKSSPHGNLSRTLPGRPNALLINPQDQYLALAFYAQPASNQQLQLLILDPETLETESSFDILPAAHFDSDHLLVSSPCFTFSPAGNQLAVAYNLSYGDADNLHISQMISIYDPITSNIINEIESPQPDEYVGNPLEVAFCPDQRYIALYGWYRLPDCNGEYSEEATGSLKVWQIQNARCIFRNLIFHLPYNITTDQPQPNTNHFTWITSHNQYAIQMPNGDIFYTNIAVDPLAPDFTQTFPEF